VCLILPWKNRKIEDDYNFLRRILHDEFSKEDCDSIIPFIISPLQTDVAFTMLFSKI